jgi:mRNA interferase MazF
MIRNKVVLVPFPFDDLSVAKVRPAVCLTEPIGSHRHIVLTFIASQSPAVLLPTDILIEPKHPDFAQTDLRVPSVLQCHRLLTATTTLIHRQLGQLSPGLQTQVQLCLR